MATAKYINFSLNILHQRKELRSLQLMYSVLTSTKTSIDVTIRNKWCKNGRRRERGRKNPEQKVDQQLFATNCSKHGDIDRAMQLLKKIVV